MENVQTFTTKEDEQISVSYNQSTYYGEEEIMHCIRACHNGEVIGELYADLATGQIMQVEVNDDHRGEGIARIMYEFAGAHFDIYHSPDEHCTPEGLIFKQAMGGEEISAEEAYNPEN